MGEEQDRDGTGDGPGDGPGVEWLTIAAAARRLGVSPRAIRGRILRKTIEWKATGNTGRLVLVRSRDVAANDPGDGPEDALDQLREELMEARLATAAAEGARFAAEALRSAEVAAKDELIAELKAMLAAARQPWWRRFIG